MLTSEDIKKFDKMDNNKFYDVCRFHENLKWMIPIGLFCLVLKDGWFGILALVIYGVWGISNEIKAEEYYNTVIMARRDHFNKTGEFPKKGE